MGIRKYGLSSLDHHFTGIAIELSPTVSFSRQFLAKAVSLKSLFKATPSFLPAIRHLFFHSSLPLSQKKCFSLLPTTSNFLILRYLNWNHWNLKRFSIVLPWQCWPFLPRRLLGRAVHSHPYRYEVVAVPSSHSTLPRTMMKSPSSSENVTKSNAPKKRSFLRKMMLSWAVRNWPGWTSRICPTSS